MFVVISCIFGTNSKKNWNWTKGSAPPTLHNKRLFNIFDDSSKLSSQRQIIDWCKERRKNNKIASAYFSWCVLFQNGSKEIEVWESFSHKTKVVSLIFHEASLAPFSNDAWMTDGPINKRNRLLRQKCDCCKKCNYFCPPPLCKKIVTKLIKFYVITHQQKYGWIFLQYSWVELW